jgi:hypothetical protein
MVEKGVIILAVIAATVCSPDTSAHAAATANSFPVIEQIIFGSVTYDKDDPGVNFASTIDAGRFDLGVPITFRLFVSDLDADIPSVPGNNSDWIQFYFDPTYDPGDLTGSSGISWTPLPNGKVFRTDPEDQDEWFQYTGSFEDVSTPATFTIGFLAEDWFYLSPTFPEVASRMYPQENDSYAYASFTFNVGVVPEPSTLLLFGAGLLGMAGIARKARPGRP